MAWNETVANRTSANIESGNGAAVHSSDDENEDNSDEEWEWETETEEESSNESLNNDMDTTDTEDNKQTEHDKKSKEKINGDKESLEKALKDAKDRLKSSVVTNDQNDRAKQSIIPPCPSPPPMMTKTNDKYIPPPPAPPILNGQQLKRKASNKLRYKATKIPHWNDLMSEIQQFRDAKSEKLRSVQCDDRSNPVLTGVKVGSNKYVYEYERDKPVADIMDEIRKGKRLKHVRTIDKSKPFVKGIRTFRRQHTKELQRSFDSTDHGNTVQPQTLAPHSSIDVDDPEELRDDLESTKQLLELEIRSKKLLEKDNKRLQSQMEKLQAEYQKLMQKNTTSSQEEESLDTLKPMESDTGGETSPGVTLRRHKITKNKSGSNLSDIESRRNSVALKRHSMIRMISDASSIQQSSPPTTKSSSSNQLAFPSNVKETEGDQTFNDMKQEVNEARQLAEDWERRYKLLQAQIADLDSVNNVNNNSLSVCRSPNNIKSIPSTSRGESCTMMRPSTRSPSATDDSGSFDLVDMEFEPGGGEEREAESTSSHLSMNPNNMANNSLSANLEQGMDEQMASRSQTETPVEEITDLETCMDDESAWMLQREARQLEQRIANLQDKREAYHRERQMLKQRTDMIMKAIGDEMKARNILREEVKEMNEAFKAEIAEMEKNERNEKELEDCYLSDEEDLASNTSTVDKLSSSSGETESNQSTQRRSSGGSTYSSDTSSEDRVDETLEDIIKFVDDNEGMDTTSSDPGQKYFENYPDENELKQFPKERRSSSANDQDDIDNQIEELNVIYDKHNDYLQAMRMSNYLMKTKIDKLYDILQMQKEKHADLQQELSRLLCEIE